MVVSDPVFNGRAVRAGDFVFYNSDYGVSAALVVDVNAQSVEMIELYPAADYDDNLTKRAEDDPVGLPFDSVAQTPDELRKGYWMFRD